MTLLQSHPQNANQAATAVAQWLQTQQVRSLQTDSRKVQSGDAFIAWPGAAVDGRAFIDQAFSLGAKVCVVEAQGLETRHAQNACVLAVPELKAQLGHIAAAYYEHPSEQMTVTAFTGTNGKTSSAWWLAHAWQALPAPWGKPCGMVGTLGVGPIEQLVSTGLTTPDPVTLHGQLQHLQQQGIAACALEASSIGIVEHRLNGLAIAHAVLTNLSQDHLDYHVNMVQYQAAKAQLFTWPGLRTVVLNVDDAFGAQLAQSDWSPGLAVWTCALHTPARLRAVDVQLSAQGTQFTVLESDAQLHVCARAHANIATVGDFNVHNLLGVLAVLRAEGVPLAVALAALRDLPAVPGRLEMITQAQKPWVLVDYAHTPDAVAQVLAALRPLAVQRGGKLWCVLGCGGNRDTTKRPLMGAAAARAADVVVVTSDNPRDEAPELIAAAVLAGANAAQAAGQAQAVHQVLDREAAIAYALAHAQATDIVLLAGKGHETTIEEKGHKRPFDDRVWARHYVQQWPRIVTAEVPA